MNNITEKKLYVSPRIELIKLDNEISLVLVSGEPGEPGEPGASLVRPEYFNNDPFKTNRV